MAKVTQKPMKTRTKIIHLVMALGNKILKEIGFVEKINESVVWDKYHCGISPGDLLKVLVLSTFTDIRTVLTRIQSRFEQVDLSFLIGEASTEHDINSFNLGRALERVGKADCNGIYETLALTAVQQNNIPLKRFHSDTTTISFYGEYDIDKESLDLTESEKAELLEIERGYNKDGRPGSNQVIVGQIVNELGIPIVSRAHDGSTSDVEWNKAAIDYMKSIQESGFTQGIYVADSKLISSGLVGSMMEEGRRINFVSRCPASFENKLESRMIRKAYADGNWTELGQFCEGRNASKYNGISYIETVSGYPIRLLVLQSSNLTEKAEKMIEKEKEQLTALIRQLSKKRYACNADASADKDRFMGNKHTSLFNIPIEIVQETKEIWPRGRRNENTRPKREEKYRISFAQVTRNEEACQRFRESESCIVLISNVTTEKSDSELLCIYKGQQLVENSFRLLKEPQLASAIYLKNPIRIKALTMVLSFALLVRAIIQFRLREGLREFTEENPGKKIYAGWNGRELKNPTYRLFYEHSVYCYFERESYGRYSFMWPNIETQRCVEPLLRLMHLDIEYMLE
jgi:transposase